MVNLIELIEALSRPEAYPHAVDAVEVHQTHISVVILAGPFAYKIKKPVNLGFLDFSTLEKRKHFCEEEVRLNRRLAPNVYLDVVPICKSEPDALARVGSDSLASASGSQIIEWAVQMMRLPNDATLESRLERNDVSDGQIQKIAERIAIFHQQADTNQHISSFGRFDVVAYNMRENFTQAESMVCITVRPEIFDRVRNLTELHLTDLRDLIEARAQRGVPRDTHGDLRLDHVYLFPDEAPPNDLVIIDCIEFADRFRYADPVADVAFLAMDLRYHGRRDLARVLTERYFEATGDREGKRLLAFYAAYRAVIRAKVIGIKIKECKFDSAAQVRDAFGRAFTLWHVALGELEAPANRPALVFLGGLPGSGKSTLARSLAQSADFHVVQSDAVRKEITQNQPCNIYTEEWSQVTYNELLNRAGYLVSEGKRVLVDANFRQDSWLLRFLDAARGWGVPFVFVHCQADTDVLHKRLTARQGDVSDADWNTYQKLEATWEPLSEAIRRVAFAIDTTPGLAVYEASVRTKLQQEGLLE
jgi:aminoglycoside phosphotransferase family enzyme/predicted kinase